MSIHMSMTLSFLKELAPFLRLRNTLEASRAQLRLRLERRQDNFLDLMERAVYANPSSPYLPLLRHAGCELEDLRSTVKTRGLESTLHQLRSEGVYITFDEFKGRQPIARHGSSYPVRASDFDNPLLTGYFTASTSGSTGVGNRVTMSLDHLAWEAQHELLFYHALGMQEAPIILCYQGFPGALGPRVLLRHLKNDLTPYAWFNPLIDTCSGGWSRTLSLINRTGFKIFARMHGHTFPGPTPMPLNAFGDLSAFVHQVLKAHGRCLFRGLLSMCLKVCIEAHHHGLDLSGAFFCGGGEPSTPARINTMTRTGARYFSNYSTAETGNIGRPCLDPKSCTDVHFFRDALALIQAERRLPDWDVPLKPFCFTSLLASAPKILLNVESDDVGTLEHRSCGCPMETSGLDWHIRDVFSFRKLTGQGVTLVGNDAQHILEEVLPARFGGTLQDYQLQESEDEQGLLQINLIVSPRIGLTEEGEVSRVFFKSLKNCSNTFAASMWSKNRVLNVVRREPFWTTRGKYMPIIPLGMNKALGLDRSKS